MIFYKNYVVIFKMLSMFKKLNVKATRDSLSQLVIAAIVGTIISFVAQLFIISAKIFMILYLTINI